MVSLIVHALLGLAVIASIIASNPRVFAKPEGGAFFSPLEIVYYLVGIASIVLGWYFNIKFVAEAHGQGNLVSGPASYPHFLRSQFASSAAGSGISDYLIANVILVYGAAFDAPGSTSCAASSPASRSRWRSTSPPSSGSAGTHSPARRWTLSFS
jgi:hypothetical protein